MQGTLPNARRSRGWSPIRGLAARAFVAHPDQRSLDRYAWLRDQHAWPGLAAIGRIVRTRELGTQTSTETAYYVLSTALSAKRFGEVARAHWGAENGLHWVLDVTMNEHQARTHKDHGHRTSRYCDVWPSTSPSSKAQGAP